MSLLWAALAYPLAGVFQAWLVDRNLARFQQPAPPLAGEPGLVSILIPARDEAATIAACVRGALAQQGLAIEVLVLDDQSGDDTAAIAIAAAGGDPRFRLLPGQPRPAGWLGKPWACWQLAEAARGEWLMFVDADTVLAPHGAAEALAFATAEGADLASYWPRQVMGTPAEQALIPLIAFILLGFLPFGVAETHPEPTATAANGQCLLLSRAAYARCGGHAGIRGEIVDDIQLARAVKRAGGKVVARDARAGAKTRMYDGFRATWLGFRKNMFPALGGTASQVLPALALLVAFHVAPPLVALAGLALGRPELLIAGLAQLGLTIAMRVAIDARLGQPLWSALLHPLAVAGMVLLALESWRGWAGAGVSWKGRVYGGSATCIPSGSSSTS